jgi:DNA-binding NtrC family response regulator
MTPALMTARLLERVALIFAGSGDLQDLEVLLRELGFTPVPLARADFAHAARDSVALCLIDLRQNGEALRTARLVRTQYPQAIVIGISDPERPTMSTDAIRAGVFDVLPRPPVARDLEAIIENAQEQALLAAAQQRVTPGARAFGIVGTSAAMRVVMDLAQRAAPGRCGILICGERGTGREMIARVIHAHEGNAEAPFVKVDCAGLAPEDVEMQLFGALAKRGGHVRSEQRALERIGEHSALVDANGGILFLENILELPPRAQARLARVLRDREAFVGTAHEPQTIDVRPIASVEPVIDDAVEEGRLRADLHERLSLVRVDVPALRQRREDIPLLATHFLKELCKASGKPLKTLTRPALTLLTALPWRGNAPELRSLLERLILLVPNGLIRLEDVLAHTQLEGSISPTGFDATLRQARARFERDYIAAVLQHQHGRISDAARILGIQRTNLYRKMRRLNLTPGKAGRTSGQEG